MSEQLTIDDLSEGERLRDEGTARAEAGDREHNDGRDIEVIDREIRIANSLGWEWSANYLRELLPEVRQPLIGARIRAAAMRKEMTRVGYEPSTLPSTHAHPIAVWRGVAR